MKRWISKNSKVLSILFFVLIWCIVALATGCENQSAEGYSGTDTYSEETTNVNDICEPTDSEWALIMPNYSGHIYLYGEEHSVQRILDHEFEIWKGFYKNQGMRHLFIEMPYYTAEYFNLWMKAEDDEIIMTIYDDFRGTAAHNMDYINFYKRIKDELPETIFHGTDVGHQYQTIGKRYLSYLEEQGLAESESYKIAVEVMEQGQCYYEKNDDNYRENKMVENFLRELSLVNNEDVMGIYGAAHTGLDAMSYNGQIDCMGKQLMSLYSSQIVSEDLSWLAKAIQPIRIDQKEVEGQIYDAGYFGKQDLTGFKDFSYREFWRLEDAYEIFKGHSKTGEVLPYDNYPAKVEFGQVYLIEYVKTDGSSYRTVYICEDEMWNNQLSTEAIKTSF